MSATLWVSIPWRGFVVFRQLGSRSRTPAVITSVSIPWRGFVVFRLEWTLPKVSVPNDCVSIPWRGFVVFRQTKKMLETAWRIAFQSPGGDLLFSDQRLVLCCLSAEKSVSIPWRGFVVFRRSLWRAFRRAVWAFQSPGGDLLFSDLPLEHAGPSTSSTPRVRGFNPLAGICCFQTEDDEGLCSRQT